MPEEEPKLYSLKQAARMTGTTMSRWSQGVQYGMINSVMRMDIGSKHASKQVPRHFVTMEAIEKFKAFIDGGHHVPSIVLKPGRNSGKHVVSSEDLSARAARRSMEMRKEAAALGMSLEEYQEVCNA